MKFGKFLQERSKLEWRLYYVDYSYLKQLIKEMKQQIVSGAQTKKEVEHKFTKAIDLEINKVNDFFLMVEKEFHGKVAQLRQVLNKPTAKDGLSTELESLANYLTDLHQYTVVNFEAFRKILKKHDRHTDMVASPWFLARCKQQPFYSSSRKFGNMLVRFSNCCAKVRNILNINSNLLEENAEQNKNYQVKRYWIKKENIMKVKTMIVQHLPIQFDSIGRGNATDSRNKPILMKKEDQTDSVLISTTYYENVKTMESYDSRLKRLEGASLIRFRSYEDNNEFISVERKVHHSNFGRSTKQSFHLFTTDIFDFIRGVYKVDDFKYYLEEKDQSEEFIDTQSHLFNEIQHEIVNKKLVPTITTNYYRSVFHSSNRYLKISIDTDILMVKDLLSISSDGKWRKPDIQLTEDDVHEFPYAVLEIRYIPDTLPEWLISLTDGPLLKQAGTYSKFIHGCTALLPELITSKPAWYPEFFQQKPEEKIEEEPADEIVDLEFNKKDWNDQHEEASENEALIEVDVTAPSSRNRKAKTSSQPRAARNENSLLDKFPFLQHLKDVFDFDQRFVKDGKPIITRMKIEPKTYFANERTFLQWMSFCVIIQGIGVALISFPGSNLVGLLSGICFVIISILFMGYSLFLFRLRAARIRNNQPGRYDDRYGPAGLFIIMTVAVLLNAILYVVTNIFTSTTSTA